MEFKLVKRVGLNRGCVGVMWVFEVRFIYKIDNVVLFKIENLGFLGNEITVFIFIIGIKFFI